MFKVLIVKFDTKQREVVPYFSHWFGTAGLLYNWYSQRGKRTTRDQTDELSHTEIYVVQEGRMRITRIDKWMLDHEGICRDYIVTVTYWRNNMTVHTSEQVEADNPEQALEKAKAKFFKANQTVLEQQVSFGTPMRLDQLIA